jgi:hypothetical protein
MDVISSDGPAVANRVVAALVGVADPATWRPFVDSRQAAGGNPAAHAGIEPAAGSNPQR